MHDMLKLYDAILHRKNQFFKTFHLTKLLFSVENAVLLCTPALLPSGRCGSISYRDIDSTLIRRPCGINIAIYEESSAVEVCVKTRRIRDSLERVKVQTDLYPMVPEATSIGIGAL